MVVRRFEPPDSPWGAGHRGVDLLATSQQAVRAAGPGTVTFAGVLAGRGVVALTHGRIRTTYEPVDPHVHLGDHLNTGDPLGELQPRSSHCAPRTCLHWGALRDTTYIDPLHLLTSGRPRLLPLDDSEPVAPPPTNRDQRRPSRPRAAPSLAPVTMAAAVVLTALATTVVATSHHPSARAPPTTRLESSAADFTASTHASRRPRALRQPRSRTSRRLHRDD